MDDDQRNFTAIVAALIDGLRIPKQSVADACFAALQSIGPPVIPLLRDACSSATLRHREKLLSAIEIIEQRQVQPNPETPVFKALIASFQVEDAALQEKVIAALRTLPAQIVDKLLQEAIVSWKKPTICLRFLQAIEQLGDPARADRYIDVGVLIASKNPDVRELAIKLFCRMGRSAAGRGQEPSGCAVS